MPKSFFPALSRFSLIKLAYLVFCLAIIARLFTIQVVHSAYYRAQARNQYQTVTETIAQRGAILASDSHPLTYSALKYLIFADPQLVDNPISTSKQLADLLYPTASPESKLKELERVEDYLSQKDSRWMPIQSYADFDTKQEISQLDIPGIGFQNQFQRNYPESSMSAHLLGFVGKDEIGEDKGYFGLEGFYDLELSGHSSIVREERDLLGLPILIGQKHKDSGTGGHTLKTSIDRSAQFAIEKHLALGISRYEAKSGTVTVMEPSTGRILAMAALPAYHPAQYSTTDPELFKNPIVATTYEPGSTFKVIALAAALDSGVVNPSTVCDICHGPLKLDKYVIRTWDNKYRPNSSVTDILVHSDNVGMVFIGNLLGTPKFLEYYQSFGFTMATGIDLEEEISPPVKDFALWTYIDRSTATFGQGIAVTPIQVLRSVAAIANGGRLITPKIVDEIVEPSRRVVLPTQPGKQIIKPQTARMVTDIMVKAVQAGEAKWAKPKDFQIAGKTGTAQIPVSGHYDEEKTIASFVGFAPAYDPKFVMLVTLQEPQTSQWGSETAAPLWFAISRDLFRLWNITP